MSSSMIKTLPPLSKLKGGQNVFNLPRLPIPTLEATAARYGRSCQGLAPFPSSAKNAEKFSEELKAHLALLDNFVKTSGTKNPEGTVRPRRTRS